MKVLREAGISLLHLFYPHLCDGCGSDILNEESRLCFNCLSQLPRTGFHMHANNPVEKIFWGRIAVTAATSEFFFSKKSIMQSLMHQFKYKGNKEIGRMLGRMLGTSLTATHRFNGVDLIVPVPMFREKERKRGYNQAIILAEGISEAILKPVDVFSLLRPEATETQTRKNRVERWENISDAFVLKGNSLNDKHVLLVDDVITTGATLESCGKTILENSSAGISIASLCFAMR